MAHFESERGKLERLSLRCVREREREMKKCKRASWRERERERE